MPYVGVGSEPLEGHLATDGSGDLLLCLLSIKAQRLTALRLPLPAAAAAVRLSAGKRVEVAFSMPAVAAAAVTAALQCHRQAGAQSGVSARDLLVLQPNGRLALFVGSRHLCTVGLPGDSGPAAVYVQLLRLGGTGGGKGEEQQLPANHSQLSGTKRPASAAEVRSGDSDGDKGEGDPMLVSPAPRPVSARTAAGRAFGDLLPDVRSLADALEPPPAVVGLQASGQMLQRGAGSRQQWQRGTWEPALL